MAGSSGVFDSAAIGAMASRFREVIGPITASTLSRSTTTDTGGRYSFFDVFTEPATVEAIDRDTNTAATGTVTIVAFFSCSILR